MRILITTFLLSCVYCLSLKSQTGSHNTRSVSSEPTNQPPIRELNKTNLSQEEQAQLRRIQITPFFGSEQLFFYSSQMASSLSKNLALKEMQDAWDRLKNSPYHLLIKQLRYQAYHLQLDDWGYCLLVHETAKKFSPYDLNYQKLFEAFVLSYSGYVVRLSKGNGRLYLLLPSRQLLYGASKLMIQNHRFYAIDLGEQLPEVQQATAVRLPYPTSAYRAIDFHSKDLPNLPLSPIRRNFSFTYDGYTYQLDVTLNKNILDYCQTIPFTKAYIRFSTPLSISARNSLIPPLTELVEGMSDQEAVNLLLRFVQEAFEYETDSSQFGGEKYLFPEETLFAPASDCEDRSILFSYLVQEVLGLETIGLQFPGHMTTGVKFEETGTFGTYMNYNGGKYYICDPTVHDATFGRNLPELNDQKAKIIKRN